MRKYIQNEDKRFHAYLANKVSAIRDVTHVSQWRHINTNGNPADDASRGLKVEDLLNGGRWIDGPSFSPKQRRNGHQPVQKPTFPVMIKKLSEMSQ